MKTFKIEVCVDSYEDAEKAYKQGAYQIELCNRLDLDGLTPSLELTKKVLSELKIYTKVMVRPRAGDFIYTPAEQIEIFDEIEQFKRLGISEIVFGAILNDRLDITLLSKVAALAYPMKVTIHKAIDNTTNVIEDILSLSKIDNIVAILSSGLKPTAMEGIPTLLKMKEACGEKIALIAAGKIIPSNLNEIHEALGLEFYHGRNILNKKDQF